MDNTQLIVADNQSEAFKKIMAEWSSSFVAIPSIRVSYQEDTAQKFISKKGDETKILGDTFKGVILKVSHQYRYFDKNESVMYMTNEFSDFNETISFGTNEKQLITGEYQTVKSFIKTTYPNAKFNEVLYLAIDEQIYRFIITPASIQSLWDFKKLTQNKAPFSFVTEFSTSKEKNGLIVFFPVHFKEIDPLSQEDFNRHLQLRIELDKILKQLSNNEVILDKETPPQKIMEVNTEDIVKKNDEEREVSKEEILDMLK